MDVIAAVVVNAPLALFMVGLLLEMYLCACVIAVAAGDAVLHWTAVQLWHC
jgi:hypothetical protein